MYKLLALPRTYITPCPKGFDQTDKLLMPAELWTEFIPADAADDVIVLRITHVEGDERRSILCGVREFMMRDNTVGVPRLLRAALALPEAPCDVVVQRELPLPPVASAVRLLVETGSHLLCTEPSEAADQLSRMLRTVTVLSKGQQLPLTWAHLPVNVRVLDLSAGTGDHQRSLSEALVADQALELVVEGLREPEEDNSWDKSALSQTLPQAPTPRQVLQTVKRPHKGVMREARLKALGAFMRGTEGKKKSEAKKIKQEKDGL